MDAAAWRILAQADLDAAKALRVAGVYLPIGFHCQQALEKVLKHRWACRFGKPPPFTHELLKLARELHGQEAGLASREPFLAELTDIYTQARYVHPNWKTTLAWLSEPSTADRLIAQTDEVYAWLLSLPT